MRSLNPVEVTRTAQTVGRGSECHAGKGWCRLGRQCKSAVVRLRAWTWDAQRRCQDPAILSRCGDFEPVVTTLASSPHREIRLSCPPRHTPKERRAHPLPAPPHTKGDGAPWALKCAAVPEPVCEAVTNFPGPERWPVPNTPAGGEHTDSGSPGPTPRTPPLRLRQSDLRRRPRGERPTRPTGARRARRAHETNRACAAAEEQQAWC